MATTNTASNTMASSSTPPPASSAVGEPHHLTLSSSTPPSKSRSASLAMRRSLDFATVSGGPGRGHGLPNGSTSSDTGNTGSSSRFGTVSGSLFTAYGTGSASGTKRSRGITPPWTGLSLTGLFNSSSSNNNVTTNDTSSNRDNVNENVDVLDGGPGAAEASLIKAVHAANDRNAPWHFTIEQTHPGQRDGLFLFSDDDDEDEDEVEQSRSNPRTRGPARDGSNTPLGRATQAAGRLFLPGKEKAKRKLNKSSRVSAGRGTDAYSTKDALLPVIYVTTGKSSLTLYRSLQDLVQLDVELRHRNPAILPEDRPSALMTTAAHGPTPRGIGESRPALTSSTSPSPSVVQADGKTSPAPIHSVSSPNHARRRSVLAALGKTLNIPSRKGTPSHSSRQMSRSGSSQSGQDMKSEDSSTPRQTASPEPLSAVSQASSSSQTQSSLSRPSALTPSQLVNLADYLSSLSSVPEIRTSAQWKKYFKPGKHDHSSARLEHPDRERNADGDRPELHGSQESKKFKKMRSENDLPRHEALRDVLASRQATALETRPGADEEHAQLHKSKGRAAGPDDSGIGGDVSTSASMMREDSTATTASRMSVFLEEGMVGHKGAALPSPSLVVEPGVLAYMHGMHDGIASSHPTPGSTSAEATQIDGSGALPQTGYSTNALVEQSGASPRQTNDSSPTAPPSEEIVERPSLSPELANAALASLHALSQPPTPADSAVPEGMDAPLASEGATHSGGPLPSPLVPAVPDNAMHDDEGEDMLKDLTSSSQAPSKRKSSRKGHAPSNTDSKGRSRKSSAYSGISVKEVGIESFDIIRVLGKGCAGKVLLTRNKETQQLYAIKAIHKHHVLAHRELAHTLTEQSILKKMATEYDNPFVVKMTWSFQDKDNLFLVLDFHPGGDLATQLARWGRLGKDRTRFYAAEMIEGLEGLHAAGVIYRDLKPENILLASDGHLVLTDFGLSKQFERPTAASGSQQAPSPPWLKDTGKAHSSSPAILGAGGNLADSQETTMTFCGTAEYLAPEVLLGNPYSYPADMWSLGTMIYEMLLGVTPFYNEHHDIMYRRVLHEQLTFGTDDYLDSDTRALLRGLLQKEPEFRMTTKRVKRSKYFEMIDWDFVHDKRYIPPFIPALSADDPEDTQNFDNAFLQMDLGFVDPSDIAEAETKAKSSGKEPDAPFDEHGRDVFEGYSFQGFREANESDFRGEDGDSEQEAEASLGEEDCKGEANEAGAADLAQVGGVTMLSKTDVTSTTNGHEQLISSTDSAESSPYSDEQDAYDTGVTSLSASGTEDGLSRHTKDTSGHPRMHSSPLSSLKEEESVNSSAKEEEEDIRASEEPITANSLSPPKALAVDAPRSSVEMPRQSFDAVKRVAADGSRVSEDPEDWDLVEAMDDSEYELNEPAKRRRRVMAGPTLFARGIADKYKLQIKPLTRAPTPTRSYITKKRNGSTTNTPRMSPSPSFGPEASVLSLAGSPESARQPRNNQAPRLLRASSEWVSSSLPSTPAPRFRIKRSKKGLSLADWSKGSTLSVQGNRVSTPTSDTSSATLPVEASRAILHPLTRQVSRSGEVESAVSEAERETENVPPSLENWRNPEQAEGGDKTRRIKRFMLDSARLSKFQTKGSSSS